MKTISDLIIIGAGPSGLYAAAHCVNQGLSILILEKNTSAGKKLLLSGSGQCNFTNNRPIKEFITCYGDHGRFLKPALFNHTNQDVIDYFYRQGVPPIIVEENGKVFPKTRKAKDLLNALLDQIKSGDIQISYDQAVKSITKNNNHFDVESTNQVFHAKHVLLATGGQSFPQTGSTGDGYVLAKKLGHTIIPPQPGLTPFDINNFILSDLAGTSFKALPISLYHGEKKNKTMTGSMVITHSGLSGPVIHNLSRYSKKGDKIKLHLFLTTNEEKANEIWTSLIAQNSLKSIGKSLQTLGLSKAFCEKLCLISSINRLSKTGLLNKKDLKVLFNNILGLELVIKNKGNFDIAMVTVGGIDVQEINSKTMESKLITNLFFTGEIMDIDGDTGGFDLQACWSTSFLASQALIKRIK